MLALWCVGPLRFALDFRTEHTWNIRQLTMNDGRAPTDHWLSQLQFYSLHSRFNCIHCSFHSKTFIQKLRPNLTGQIQLHRHFKGMSYFWSLEFVFHWKILHFDGKFRIFHFFFFINRTKIQNYAKNESYKYAEAIGSAFFPHLKLEGILPMVETVVMLDWSWRLNVWVDRKQQRNKNVCRSVAWESFEPFTERMLLTMPVCHKQIYHFELIRMRESHAHT